MNKIFLKLINLVKVTLDKLLPSFPAIGSRIYKPYFSPAYVGKNILEQDKYGRTVAGSISKLISAQQAGHDIVLHIQDSGPKYLMGYSNYSYKGTCYLYGDRHIGKGYTSPNLKDKYISTTAVVYSSKSESFLGRTSLCEKKVLSNLRINEAYYKRWIWIQTTKFKPIKQNEIFRYVPYCKIIIKFNGGPLICTLLNAIVSKPESNRWMRNPKEFCIKTNEILIPGYVLKSMTRNNVRNKFIYKCYFQFWFNGKVRVFVCERFKMNKKFENNNLNHQFAFDTYPKVSFVGI